LNAVPMPGETAIREVVDLSATSLRDLHEVLHGLDPATNRTAWRLLNPDGRHAVAVGLDAPIDVIVEGHVGYYAAGMNARASVTINGNAGQGVAENMMSGMAAGATAHGGLLVIEGNAGARCGISIKGIDIVVRGSVGHMSGFMAQEGNLVVCGNAGDALGDSLYEARIFVAGAVKSLGADCEEKPMDVVDRAILEALLDRAGVTEPEPAAFRLFGSARRLYHFHVDNANAY
jgi:glutamate synthase domain-containing protein 3